MDGPASRSQVVLASANAHWTEPPTFDARPGGRFGLRLIAKDELYDLHGTFLDVRSPEKLVLNWRWDKDRSNR